MLYPWGCKSIYATLDCLIPLDPCYNLLNKTIISALAGGSALKEVDKIESELEVVDIDAIQVHPQ